MQREVTTTPFHRRLPSVILLVLFAVLQLLIVSIAFLGGYFLQEWRSGESLFGPRFPLLSEAYKLFKDNAYFELPSDKALQYGMIKGMLQAYDEPFTVFVEPPQHELQSQELQGKYGGVGVRIERDAKNNVYLYPVAGSPSAKAGVRDGDRLLKIDDLAIMPDTKNDEIQAAIRGPVGKKVKFTLGHSPDYAPVVLLIDRAEISLPSTAWNIVPNEPKIGILHIHVIAETTPAEITKAIKDLQQQGATHFILDVRNNGGGLVESGVNMARLFLQSGTVIEEQYRGHPVTSYKVTSVGPFASLPVVVLVNRGTASAAEIFAGALQGQKRAPIVGTRTYGKDTIQLVFSLSDGSSLHVTAAHWWVPGLPNRIGGKGLQPDIPLSENADDSQNLQKAIQALPQ